MVHHCGLALCIPTLPSCRRLLVRLLQPPPPAAADEAQDEDEEPRQQCFMCGTLHRFKAAAANNVGGVSFQTSMPPRPMCAGCVRRSTLWGQLTPADGGDAGV